MSEKITVKNFGGLDEVIIPLNYINIFIGKQASGKSVSAKLIFFFKNIFNDIFLKRLDRRKSADIIKELIEKFESYFPFEIWKDEEFEILYEFKEHRIRIRKTLNTKLRLTFSKEIGDLLEKDFSLENVNETRELFYKSLKGKFGEFAANSQVFIPAGRSFFSTFHNSIYSLLNEPIDPFLIEFGKFYQRTKKPSLLESKNTESDKHIEKLIAEILVGKYKREDDRDFIVHKDKRKVEISFASSGQQEVLPLSLILARFNKIIHTSGGTTFYIEEPEAHLFPSAQKKIVELIATVYNNPKINLQFVITTHSPYILSSFNNLLYAGLLKEQKKDKKMIEKIVSAYSIIKPNELNAFEMRDGKIVNLIDRDLGLITATTLDKASEDIAKEFDALLEFE